MTQREEREVGGHKMLEKVELQSKIYLMQEKENVASHQKERTRILLKDFEKKEKLFHKRITSLEKKICLFQDQRPSSSPSAHKDTQ